MQRSRSLQLRSLVPGGAFSGLGEGARADFEAIGVDFVIPCGAVLFHENTPGIRVLLIHSGRVKLSCTSRDDKTLLLKVAVPGDILGLSAVVSRSRYEVTARTIAPTIFRSVPGELFRSFLAKHGEASMQAAQMLSDAYRAVFVDVRRLALSESSAARLAGVLLGNCRVDRQARDATHYGVVAWGSGESRRLLPRDRNPNPGRVPAAEADRD